MGQILIAVQVYITGLQDVLDLIGSMLSSSPWPQHHRSGGNKK
jgi:hypothetical protein